MAATDAARSLLEPQRDVFLSNAEIVLAIAGIRGGKTDIGALKTIARAIDDPTEEDQCHAVVSPTFPMSKLGPEPKLLKLLHDKRLWGNATPMVDWSKSQRTFFIANKEGGVSKIRIFSGDDPHRWRGDAWRSMWGDEAARLSKEAWDVAQGRLSDTGGPALFTTTPDGHNFIYDLAQAATIDLPRVGYTCKVSEDRKTVLVNWASTYNTFLKKSRFDRLKGTYDEDMYAQEVLGLFVGRTGTIYKAFNKGCITEMGMPVGDIFLGQDFNVGRMATVFLQARHVTKSALPGLHAFDELEIKDGDTYVLVKKLRAWCEKNRIPWSRLVVCPDASSRKRSTTARSDTAKSDLEILRKEGLRIQGPRANPPVKDRINCVNGLFYNGRLTVSPKCPLLIEALEKQAYDDKGEPEKDGILDNRNDALGYACWAKFPLAPVRALIAGKKAA